MRSPELELLLEELELLVEELELLELLEELELLLAEDEVLLEPDGVVPPQPATPARINSINDVANFEFMSKPC